MPLVQHLNYKEKHPLRLSTGGLKLSEVMMLFVSLSHPYGNLLGNPRAPKAKQR